MSGKPESASSYYCFRSHFSKFVIGFWPLPSRVLESSERARVSGWRVMTLVSWITDGDNGARTAHMRKQLRISPLFLLLVALGFVTLLRGSALFHQRPIRKSLMRAEIANIRDQFYDEAP